MRSIQERVAQVYYTHGLICASHPIVILVSVCSVILMLCYPLLYMPLPGNVPTEFVTPVKGYRVPPERYTPKHRAFDSTEVPRWYAGPAVGYIQQIVVKATVSPWEPSNHDPIDAFRAPLNKVFEMLEELNKFRYRNGTEDKSIVDVCLRVSEPLQARQADGLLPEYSCLILSPANFWRRDQKRYYEDKEPLKTLFGRYGKTLEAPPGIRDVLFGIPWSKTGISRYFIRNKQRTISFAVTLVFKSFDERFMSSLRQKLESLFPDTATHVNNTQIDYIVNLHYKNINIYFEYIHLIVLYFVILLYLYFSVKKIEMVKSKWGLALSAVVTVVSSLCISVSMCSQLRLSSRLNGGKIFSNLVVLTGVGSLFLLIYTYFSMEIFPYLVVLIGVENVVVITKSVVSTSIELDVKYRVASGLSKEGWYITKNLMIELAIVFVGFFTFVPAIQEFCLIALVGILTDFFLQMIFFVTVLSVDIRRMELSDLQKYKHTSPAPNDHVTFEPLLNCPFKPHHKGPKFVPHLNLSSGMSMITTKGAPTSPRVQHEQRFFERPGLLEIPRRIRLIYFWASTRLMQRIIMVCTVIWIGLIVYKSGIVHHLTNSTYVGNDTEALEQIIKQEVLKTEPGSSDQVKVTGETSLAFIWRHDSDIPGSVGHTDLETWRKLAHNHWVTLFGYYNISIYGKYISVLPTIHLSSIIPPEEAIKFRKPYWNSNWPSDSTQYPLKADITVQGVRKDQQKYVGRTEEELDAHRNNKADFEAFSEEYLRKYYPFIDAEQIQQMLQYYPKSRKEYVITICLGVLSVICISYFMMALYKCMCSRKYSKWRADWSKSARKGKMNNYIKQIKDSLPIVLRGHLQEIECLVTEGSVIVSCCLGGQLRVWDSITGECLHVMQRKSATPPMKRRVEGRNIEDSDADLYAEYHGSDSNLNDDLDLSGSHDNSSNIRHRVSFSCQPEKEVENNPFEFQPNLSSTIETNFTSMYHKKADNSEKFSKDQSSKSGSSSELGNHEVTNGDKKENLNNSAEKGYDFGSKFKELYREQRHVVEDSRVREAQRRSYQERRNISENMSNRSKSWSEGDFSGTSDGLFTECESGPSPIWCITCRGNLIIAGCGNGRIEFWDAASGVLKCIYGECEIGVTGVNFVSKRVIVARLDGTIDFLELETFQDPKASTPLSPSSLNRKIKGHSRHLSHSRTGSDDRHLWNEIIHCTLVQRSNAHSRPITVMQTEGGRIVSGSQDFTLKVFRLEDYACLYTLHGHTGSITALYLDKCPPYAAVSGSADGSIRLWDLLTGHCVHKVKGHDGAIVSLTCTDAYIISSGLDDKMCVWERKRGHLLYSVDMETSCGSSMAMLNNNFLVTGGEGCLYLWDVHKGELVRVVNLQDREKTAFIHHIQAMENSTIVCDFGSEIKVIHFPVVLEKVE